MIFSLSRDVTRFLSLDSIKKKKMTVKNSICQLGTPK